MAEESVIKNTGLRGVKVADTKISFIDGEKGVLIYRGYRIEDIVSHSTFILRLRKQHICCLKVSFLHPLS